MAAPRERVPVSAATLLRSLKPRSSTELGTLRQSLRTEIAQATGARHVFLTGSARLGILWLLEEAVNRHGGGEALLWNYNFFAVPQAAEAAGLTPVFVDSANTWGEPTLEAMHASCTPKTRALLVSHHFGRPSNMDVWCQFAEERNLAIVEDCAHAFASKYDGTSVGLFGLGGVFSLSLTKTLTGVAGGAIITNDDEVAAHLAVKEAALAEPAADAVAKSVVSALAGKILLSRPTYSALFHTGNRVAAGFGSDPIDTLMTEPVPADGEMPPASSPTRKALAGPYASIARTHLTTVATEVAERRDCAHALIEAAQAAGVSENLQFPARETDRTNTFLNFVVRSEQPKALRARLLSAGFDTRRDYILPMNRDDEQFPHSNELTRTGVYLPVRSLRTAEIGKLVQALARVVLALLVMASGACEDAPEESTEGTEETEDPTVLPDQTIAFTNVAPLVGLSGFQDDPESCQTEAVLERVTGCYIEGWTGGVAVGDFDGDTLTDLYFPRIGAADSLFRNLGDGTFEDVAESVGVGIDVSTNGAAFADIDNDGDLDLIVTVLGGTGHLLFVNYDGVFVEEGQERGLADLDGLQFGTTPAFGDYDRDGYVDLYIANQTPPNQEPAIDTVVASQLYRNAGVTRPGFFENSTVAAGVGEVVGGFAPSFVDLDDDGWLDLQVVAIDGSSRLFWNEAGAFVDGSGDA
ncbi:MAG: dTDP-4-amino-4,6-dideoxygalactose transaminase/Fe-S-cluster formation regulator IscX/YfhJ, partial [Bradymonadia bacterium]